MKRFIILGMLLAAAGCSSPQKQKTSRSGMQKAGEGTGTSIEAKQVANEEQASYVTEIKFPKDQISLNNAARDQIRKVVDQAAAKGSISEVKVITWADAEYPAIHTEKLSSEAVRMADQRNDQIKNFLKDRKVKVEAYNMAERPGALAGLFGTENAQIKKSLETAGIPNTDTSVKAPAKASKSIVMVILK